MIEKVATYKHIIDKDLLRFSAEWRQQWQAYPPATQVVLESMLDFLNRGGKRVRGALAMESYYLHGGTNEATALGAARVIELVQTCLLIMDDIQDHSALRRGGPTVHTQLAEVYGTAYGVGQALNAVMLANQRAMSELLALDGSDTAKNQAASLLSNNISTTIIGQINDIYNQAVHQQATRQAIIDTLTWKTAYYSFISPLELGACLAGQNKLGARLQQYALNAGLAFQIHDDILGVFGSLELGKSADDDIREGKATLLTAYAYEHATATQHQHLGDILGKQAASAQECNTVRAIFEATGALAFAKKEAKRYAVAAKTALGATAEPFLADLVDFAVNRKV